MLKAKAMINDENATDKVLDDIWFLELEEKILDYARREIRFKSLNNITTKNIVDGLVALDTISQKSSMCLKALETLDYRKGVVNNDVKRLARKRYLTKTDLLVLASNDY